jgi:hypothetical protein
LRRRAVDSRALDSLTFGLIRFQGTSLDLPAGRRPPHDYAAHRCCYAFRNATFWGANIDTFFRYAAIGGSRYVHHATPTAAGASLLPFTVIMFVFARPSGGRERGRHCAGRDPPRTGFTTSGLTGARRSRRRQCVGITKALPAAGPLGQRAVTVLSRV